jgi:DNA primase
LHEDRTPSLHCYPDGTFCCFGCRTGGTIYDFAGALWGIETKGYAFVALRARLGEELGLTRGDAAPSWRRRGAAIALAAGERGRRDMRPTNHERTMR